jgi:hypothetical protein
MDRITLAQNFKELFLGNQEAYGTAAGGAVRGKPPWLRHLSGEEPIGVYPWVDGNVRWGCVDFDVKADNHPAYDFETEQEAHEAADTLRRVLAKFGIEAWIERTRSHGRHVWVFAREWVSAVDMRRALLVACEIADVPTREVNPKSEELAEGQLGNYVNLPYPGGVNATERLIMATNDWSDSWAIETFVTNALGNRTDPSVIQGVSQLWRSPPTPEVVYVEYDGDAKLNPQGRAVWEYGPEDGDRSRGMIYLARQCRESALTPEQAMAVLHSAEWNKYAGRNDEEKRLTDIVERAYQ